MEHADTFFSEMLESGVQVVGQPMAGVESVAIGILVGAGARDERPERFGVSHFTEQTLFRGTEHYDARELSERFDVLGISYDSSAGIEMTLVSAVLLGNKLPAAIDILADVVRFPAFPEDAIENVRAQIVQEVRQREDNAPQRVMDTLRQRFFAGSPLSHDVLGSEASVAALKRDDLVAYWSDRYTANNMIVSVAGNFEWEAVIRQLRSLTSDWRQGAGRLHVRAPVPNRTITILEKDTKQENIGMAFPGIPVADPRYYTASIVSIAFGGGTTSRLFSEIREKRGLAYAAQCRFDGLEKTGIFRIYVGTSADRAHESVDVVMNEIGKLERGGITQDELDRARTRLKSSLVMRSESTSARMAANLRSWWFEQRLHSLQEVRDRIDAVTIEECSTLLQELRISENVAVVALGPRTQEELFGSVATAS